MSRRPNARPDARLESLQSLIEHYGYFAVFLGCFLEGETVLVLAGFAAHMGYLSLPGVIAWVRWLTSRTPSNGRSRANPDAVEPLRKHLAHYPLVDP